MFTNADTVSTYSRAQAIEDGYLIDISTTAREAGLIFPTAISCAAWEDCVAWKHEDSKRKGIPQDEAGRLWDVVYMLRTRIRYMASHEDADNLTFTLFRVPRTGSGFRAHQVILKAICGPGDTAEPVITIMQTNED